MFHEKWKKTSTMARRLGIALWGLAIVCGVQQARAAIPDTERAALIDLYNSTNGTGWTRSDNWLDVAGTECSWYGVTCDNTEKHVIAIVLESNHLAGVLSDLTPLTQLEQFRIRSNSVQGPIPGLSALAHLVHLDFGDNSFSGTLPSLAGLNNLVTFFAHRNQLVGALPQLTGSSLLRMFVVSRNGLTGTIPPLTGLAQLQYFDVSYNQLSGTVPDMSANTGLIGLGLRDNHFSGQLPDLHRFHILHELYASNNDFGGNLPEISGLNNLEFFYADNNHIQGPLPDLNGLSHLKHFWVQGNELSGHIPSLQALTSLESIVLRGNFLTGSVPNPPNSNQLNTASDLCRNYLKHESLPAWDYLTGDTPWYLHCPDAPAGPVISISPSSIEEEISAGGSTQTLLTVANTGTTSLHWSIVQAEGSCGNLTATQWIALATQGSTVPAGAVANVAVDLVSGPLGPGTYSTVICVASDDPAQSIIEIPVEMQIHPSPTPSISVLPASFEVSTVEGFDREASLFVSNAGGGALNWSISAQSPCGPGGQVISWLLTDPVGGTTGVGANKEVKVLFKTNSLASGIYDASICIDSDDPDHAQTTLPVMLTVRPFMPIAAVAPLELDLKASAGTIVDAVLSIANDGTVDLHWTLDTAEDDCTQPTSIPWLIGGQISGTVQPDDQRGVALEFDATAIRNGTYAAKLCLATDDPQHKTIEAPVTFTVGALPPHESIFGDGFELPHASTRLH